MHLTVCQRTGDFAAELRRERGRRRDFERRVPLGRRGRRSFAGAGYLPRIPGEQSSRRQLRASTARRAAWRGLWQWQRRSTMRVGVVMWSV